MSVEKVNFVNYGLQYSLIKDEIDNAIHGCLENGNLILRSDVSDFENNFAKFIGKKYCIGTGSCTGAMYLSLNACGIGIGDEVITVGHTYIATIDVIVRAGATPILIDIGNDFNIDINEIGNAITPNTKAIIPVHLNGRCCNMDELMEIAEMHNLTVIEDVAQAVGAKYRSKNAGNFGLTSAFSFYPAKVFGSLGDGGAICTNDESLAGKLYMLRDHGEKPSYLRNANDNYNRQIYFYGYNSILDNIQAAVLNTKLPYLPEWIKRRREIAKIYDLELSDKVIKPPAPEESPYYDVYQNYVIRTKNRDKLADYLKSKGIENLISWRVPNHKQLALKLDHFHFPMTERVSDEVLSLPMYPELSDEEIKYVCSEVNNFFK